MPAYRYKKLALNYSALRNAVPGTITPGGTGAPIFADINAPVESKSDLDDYMTETGWVFIGTDLVASPNLDARSYPKAVINIAAGGVITLTPAQAEKVYIVLNGVLAANAVIEFPAVEGADWVVKNNATLGAFTVTLKAVGQPAAGIVLGSGTMSIWNDGNNMQKSSGLIS